MSRLMQDVRFAVRRLRQSPGFTAAAVITLALGIGANTTIFTAVSAIIFRPLPVERPNELVSFNTRTTKVEYPVQSLPNYHGSFEGAWRTIQGYEVVHLIRKGQVRWLPKGDVLGQIQFIRETLGLKS